jgi:hypothetical protein
VVGARLAVQCTHTHNELSQDSPVTFAKVESSVTKILRRIGHKEH